MRSLYLAYGSNLSVEQMLKRCPDAVYVGTAELKDYRLLFRGSQTGSYLTVEKAKGHIVPLLVWKVSRRDEKNLDIYEGAPRFYRKEQMTVNVHSLVDGSVIGTVPAFIYIMNDSRKAGPPSDLYYRTCRDGYRRFGFDEGILLDAYVESTGCKSLIG